MKNGVSIKVEIFIVIILEISKTGQILNKALLYLLPCKLFKSADIDQTDT